MLEGNSFRILSGGTMYQYSSPMSTNGLSPRLRGNPAPSGPPCLRCGSIPAPAGEPPPGPPPSPAPWVYPRACGGTGAPMPRITSERGLSPRLRGNRVVARRA